MNRTIQTNTKLLAIAITTAAIAMLSASALISSNGMQQAFALAGGNSCRAAGGTPGSTCFCYEYTPASINVHNYKCFTGKGACQKAQSSDADAIGSCQKTFQKP